MTKYITVKLTKDQLQYILEVLQDHEIKTGFETRFSMKLNKLAKSQE